MTMDQLRKRFALHVVTASQWRSIAAAVIGALVTLSTSLPGLPGMLKSAGINAPHWLTGAVQIACLVITLLARSPLARRSGLTTQDPHVQENVNEAQDSIAKSNWFIASSDDKLYVRQQEPSSPSPVLPERKTLMNIFAKFTSQTAYAAVKEELETTLAPLVEQEVDTEAPKAASQVIAAIDAKLPGYVDDLVGKAPSWLQGIIKPYREVAVAYIESKADSFIESEYSRLLSEAEAKAKTVLPLVPDASAPETVPAEPAVTF